ncbi:MAG: ABC transporter ATP-binding protein/permease [Oscillospiraceae bacterium]|nr:ABC transporter ATP-binding protein/permease [Oscillospiraceae bacterium]
MKRSGTLRVFASYYRPHLHLFILDMACALLIALIDLAFPYLSRYSMQKLLPERLYAAFFTVIGILIAAYLLRGACYYIVAYWGHLMGVRIEADIRRDMFAHLQRLSFRFYDNNQTGQLVSRMTGDLFEITELAHHGPEDLFVSIVTLTGAFLIMLTVRWELALVLLVVVPLFLCFTVALRRRLNRVSLGVKQKLGEINGQVESSLSGMRTAKAFANEALEGEKFRLANDRFRTSKNSYYSAMATYQSVLEFALSIMSVLVIAAGGVLIMQERMDYIDLITFSLYVSTFITPMRKLSTFVEQYTQGMAGFKRFLSLMRQEPDIQDAPDAVELTGVRGEVELRHVFFGYSPEKPPVLEDVSLHIRPGETVALVGASGGGKSTLCQLLPRFYDVTGGAVLIDGRDVRQVTQASLRGSIGIVQQDVFLFAGTIYENILYGKPDATQQEIEQAARRAELYEDIMAMPQGFQTQVGERGVMLSGGQKQRVSIARIFLKNPPVLILDEATSALDSVTEQHIQQAFEELAKGRTTLIVAHRLSTIRSASRILVIDGHRVAEEGTHQQLLAQGGRYAALWRAQNGGGHE